jgi:outer membrane protein OmpA-like peptidoglycan-associated protein
MTIRNSGIVGLCLAAAAALALAPTASRADGFYIGGEAGWTQLDDQTNSVSGGGPSAKVTFDSGYALGARAGYEWGPWRIEEEYIFHNGDLDKLSIGGVGIGGASGSRDSHAFMTNVIYDFQVGWPITPHIGAGIGAVDIIEHARAPGIGALANQRSWEFGYQAIAGARYNLSPQLALDLDYRYFATTDPSFRLIPTGATYHTSYSTQNILASLTFRFAPPPPPPAMAPAAAPAAPPPPAKKVFLVFFDWDRDTITPEGMRIIEQAANAYKSGAAVQIQVTGYTDRSGSAAYNQRLSERRANHVADALVRLGVPRNQMVVSGRGENDNRVPTADGVREPQNRRVEILFP